MALTPERFIWATELLNIKPDNSVLEIGCGAGLLAELIASQLTTGQFTGIDKSGSMLNKAKQRNNKYIEQGISRFIVSDFLRAKLPALTFDSIVAFNVNFFWKTPAKEIEIIKGLLKKNGKLFVFYQAPFEINVTAAEPVRKNLIKHSFEILDIHWKKLSPTSAFCIIAKPAGNEW